MTDTLQVPWQELAAIVATLGLTPGYSTSTRRCYVRVDDATLLWADDPGWLDPAVPGALGLSVARFTAVCCARWPDMLDREIHSEDPTDHQLDAALRRQGRLVGDYEDAPNHADY